MNGIASVVATAVEQQRDTVQEIVRSAQAVVTSSGAASANMEAVTGGTSQTGQAVENAVARVGELTHESELLGRQVDQFLGTIRRAG